MREFLFSHKRVLNHIESLPDPESPFRTPLMTIFIKAKKFTDNDTLHVAVPELPEVSVPSSPKIFPASKKVLKSRQKANEGSFCDSKLVIKQIFDSEYVNGSKKYRIGNKSEVSLGGRSNSDIGEATKKKHLSFPSSFKVKKSGKSSANSVYYQVSPERFLLSHVNTLTSKGRYFANEGNKSSTPTPQSRKPSYISKGSYKANFFSSKIDKILKRYKSESTKSSVKKFVL